MIVKAESEKNVTLDNNIKMDRFEWCDGSLQTSEQLVDQQTGVAIYDGSEKVSVDWKSA